MNALRNIRILPVVLAAALGLALLKITGLLLDGGYILKQDASPQPDAPLSWAQRTFNFPTASGRNDVFEVTGSVPEPPKAAKKEEPKQPLEGTPVQMDAGPQQVLPAERAILERLQARRQELEARARELDIRENLLKATEKRIESKSEELKAVEQRGADAGKAREEAQGARVKGLVTMYENMKPRDAAKIFDRLEMPVLFEISSQIKPAKMADILAQMQPEAAEKLTVELARRGPDKGAVAELPKIEGRPPAR
jgi:flagellar motility protein MotE (MotC chaperone)